MTKGGYEPLSLIASFNRVRSLCADIYLIADVRSKLCAFSRERKTTNFFIDLGHSR